MINVFGSKVSKRALEIISKSIENQWLGMGPNVKDFENNMIKRLNLSNFLLVDSGSNALFMAVKLLNLPPNSEIIVPSFTWVSCAQAVILAGHRPIFCDVDLDSHNVTADLIKNQITEKTAAIMVVHYAGLPVDMDSIIELGYPIIEDAAHAVDSFYKGKACGSLGDVGIYSFDAVKNLTMGEGGGLTTKKEELANRARTLRYCGIGKSGFEASTHGKNRWWEYDIKEVFIKMNPSDISAAIGLEQLENLDDLQSYRKEIWDIYQKEFVDLNWVTTPVNALDHSTHSYFTYTIRVPQRDNFAKFLFENGIYSTLRYHPLHLNDIYAYHKKLKNSEILNEEAISIPLHPNLSSENIDYIIKTIKKFKQFI